VRLNFSKGGVSASLGARGAWYTVSRGGRRRTTVGVPGTGVYFTRVSRVPVAGVVPAGAGAQRSLGARILRGVLIAFAVYIAVALVVVLVGGAILEH
jgi:Protein of unknown function (DUF4236)